MMYEVDIRSRATGNTCFVILKTENADEAYKLAKSFNEINVKGFNQDVCMESYIDGGNGYVADVFQNETELPGASFINDEEKMCDFFSLKREEFLKFYSYLDNYDYCKTLCDVVEKVNYHNKEAVIEEFTDDVKTLQFNYLPDGCDVMKDIVAPYMFMKLFVDTKTN